MANDQFLESQRLMMMDMCRIESVLSAEQTRQIAGTGCSLAIYTQNFKG